MSPKMDVDGLLVWLTGDSICNLSYVYVTYWMAIPSLRYNRSAQA
jgi:hypothetical protein